MTKKLITLLLFFSLLPVASQIKNKNFRSKIFTLKSDLVKIDSLTINSQDFQVFDSKDSLISTDDYKIDFQKAELTINHKKYSIIKVNYYRFPEFITKVYTPIDASVIVPNTSVTNKLYSQTTNKKKSKIDFFDDINTKGFITRGVTAGNNQNAVTNSVLDLTIEGKLSPKVGIRANIFDTNFPLQEGGYSQNITDFDRIFIELFSKKWRIRGGDISLSNKESYFLNFEKQVAGVEVEAAIGDKGNVLASGAVVRGQFSAYNFVGVEGNQGPYKIFGPNNQTFLVLVAGSDRVYVNGVLLERGENKDYVIDYNLAEIRFNTTYPITNDMRIRVEYQFSEQNYTRFITYDKTTFTSDKFSIGGYFYSENDAKSQPLQQSLTAEQKEILANAGNDESQMIAPSAYPDSYAPNRIQYRKVTNNGVEFFEYTTDENEDVYTVSFTNVGSGFGSYNVLKTIATGTVYEYVGENLGSFLPVTRLIAPTKLQVAVINTSYKPTPKTTINAEVALSNNDKNLFSSISDEENKTMATNINWKQVLIDKKWQLESAVNYQFVQNNFTTVQRFRTVEFNRDWNIFNPEGNQQLFGVSFSYKNKKNSFINYGYNQLSFSNDFNGVKHSLAAQLGEKRTKFVLKSSFLTNSGAINDDTFFRAQSKLVHSFKRSWIGGLTSVERNKRFNKSTEFYELNSHQFKEFETFYGIGDSTKVYAKLGVNYRENDSIKNNQFTQINNRKTFYVNSRLIKNKNTNVSVFANYRFTENRFQNNEKSLNSRLTYNQLLFKKFIRLSSVYETSSGNIAQQEFVYIKVEPGQGYYTWIDYNNDGEQQFDEFEIAQFQDQADYLRVALPNITFLPTQKAKWKQTVILNASIWKQQKGLKKWLSHFYNQTNWLIDNEQKRVGSSFNLNPFDFDEDKLLALTYNFRNSFYYNRNLQNYSWVYTYGTTKSKQQFNIGNQESTSDIHQLDFQHKFSTYWLFQCLVSTANNKLITENFSNRNFDLKVQELQPKLSFLYNKNHRLTAFYQYKDKVNTLESFEELLQHKIGLEYFFSSLKKNQISANFNLFQNNFIGNQNSPVGYQMLEGLQPGKNYTWNVLVNQKINSLLTLNLSYLGRKSPTAKTIHTGMVQLRANF